MYTNIYVYGKPIYMGRHMYVCLLHGAAVGKGSTFQCGRCKFYPWVGKVPWSRKWEPPPEFLPGKLHGQRSLARYSPWGPKESDTTEHEHASMYIYIFFFTYRLLQKIEYSSMCYTVTYFTYSTLYMLIPIS